MDPSHRKSLFIVWSPGDRLSDTSFLLLTMTPNTMYVHHSVEDEGYPNVSSEKFPASESSGWRRGAIRPALMPGGNEILKFIRTGKPVSAAQYACWHRIVQEQLACNMGPEPTINELARTCFREIEQVHRFSRGWYFGGISLMNRIHLNGDTATTEASEWSQLYTYEDGYRETSSLEQEECREWADNSPCRAHWWSYIRHISVFISLFRRNLVMREGNWMWCLKYF